jgi:hypothetical protein
MTTNPFVSVRCKNLEVLADPTNSFITLVQTLTHHLDRFIREPVVPESSIPILKWNHSTARRCQAERVTISLIRSLRFSGTALLAP